MPHLSRSVRFRPSFDSLSMRIMPSTMSGGNPRDPMEPAYVAPPRTYAPAKPVDPMDPPAPNNDPPTDESTN